MIKPPISWWSVAIGFGRRARWKTESDFFLGSRSASGKGLSDHALALCTGTHSEMAVQVAVFATARVGLGGIWYQWMWLFSTPVLLADGSRTWRLHGDNDRRLFRIPLRPRPGNALRSRGLFYFGLSIAPSALRWSRAAGHYPERPARCPHQCVGAIKALCRLVLNLRRCRRSGGCAGLHPTCCAGIDDHRCCRFMSWSPPGWAWSVVYPACTTGFGPAMFARSTTPPEPREGDPCLLLRRCRPWAWSDSSFSRTS